MKKEWTNSIIDTRKGFEESFTEGSFYRKQTRDTIHLKKILNALEIKEEMKILDLGTGMGYLAFPLAEKYPRIEVVGLDIVEQTLKVNREQVKSKGLKNLQFVNYDGLIFPFENETFDWVITRYALHHFPAIEDTFREIAKVLKPDGRLFLADPTPNDNDTEGFIDAYMQMKKDGHIKFYTKKEWKNIGESVGLKLTDDFETYIRFPKKKSTALEFDDLMGKFDNRIIKGYLLEIIDDEIWITEKVNNLLFKKNL